MTKKLDQSNNFPKTINLEDEKHTKVMEAILPFAKKTEQKKLTHVNINNVTRKTKIRFFLLPEWAINFPPYNLARLVAVAREAGYSADAIDLNIKAFRQYEKWNIDFNPWHGSKEWQWMENYYFVDLHKHLEPLLEYYIDQIAKDKINVIGFSLYYCNQAPTDWMAKEIKKRYPDIITIVGGPQCHAFPPGKDKPFYDYVVSGEGENLLLEVLEEIESGIKLEDQKFLKQAEGTRLNLDTLPKADYSDFDFRDYLMPNGVNAEFSRGCTAKCVFCSETHFWKYRGRTAEGTLGEVLDLYKNKGVDYIWFLDSLVNGNLKELRAFCKGIIASGAKIRWTGYARCDKRMDFEYMKDLADSGCHMLSYGIESGSDKVLKDMDKRVTRNEIEQNLKDGHQLGIIAHCNWIVGFPTETTQDFYESMLLIWRNRNYIKIVAAGHGFTEPPDTIISQNSEKFGMLKSYYLNNWITGDFKNSKVHRMIRLVTFNIFLNNIRTDLAPNTLQNFDTSKYYNINFKDPNILNNIEFETFNFNIINPNINPFVDSLINEVWPLLRILWIARGAYDIQIKIDPNSIQKEFGNRLGCNYSGNYIFSIDDEGHWTADFKINFQQDNDAWRYQDYSRETSTSARRARMLAIPESKGEVVWNYSIYDKHLAALEEHKKLDFTFTYEYSNQGKWNKNI